MPKKRKSGGFTFRLLVAPHFNERQQKYTTRIALQTTQAFANYRYDLSVAEDRSPGTLKFAVRGLRTPQVGLPGPGTARFEREYDDLRGTVAIAVEGLNKISTTCTVRIQPRAVKMVTPPSGPDVTLVTSEADWNS
jgi:hypothetical protein